MRRLAVGIGVALAALSAAPAQARVHSCAVPHSKTLFENTRARVFTRTYGADRDVRTQVCRKSAGHHIGLAQDVGDLSRRRVRLVSGVGGWLAYAVTQEGGSPTTTGEACRFKIAAGQRHCTAGLVVHGVGVTRAGTLAWLANSGVDSGGEPFCCSVYRLDAGAKQPDLLDSGGDIEADSFAVSAHRAYWTKAGEPRSAQLP